MIRETTGDLLSAPADAIVNTVNTVGVMGRGIALQFKKRFPENFKAYERACKAGEVQLGSVHIFETGAMLEQPRWIINFPTKGHWKSRSRIEDIASGLDDLVEKIASLQIRSIAIPPLGCGLGGLEWADVRPLIEQKLENVDAEILLYSPSGPPAAADMDVRTQRPAMSIGKAALVHILHEYSPPATGATPIEVQKLMYFLQEAGEPLRLDFQKNRYGPYADNLRHVLNRVEGHFVTGVGDNSSAVTQAPPISVLDEAQVEASDVMAAHPEAKQRVDRVLELAQGFESAYGMELLATVHWSVQHEGFQSPGDVIQAVQGWNSRKARLFTKHHIEVALRQLAARNWIEDSFGDRVAV